MIEINSAVAIFVGEALIALLLVLIIMLLISVKRKSRDRAAASGLIKKISKGGEMREQELLDLLGEDSGLDADDLGLHIKEIQKQERELYQHVIQLYLKRDVKMLARIDQQVQALSEPYRQLLSEKSGEAEIDPALLEEIDKIRAEQEVLRNDNERLANQLGIAMETMDEVSSEYSMMFGGSKAVEELSASKERMMAIFQQGTEKFSETLDEEAGEFPEAEEI